MSNAFGDGSPGADPAYSQSNDHAYGVPPEPYWAPQSGQPVVPDVPDRRRRNVAILGAVGVAVVAVIGLVAVVILRTFAVEPAEPGAAQAPGTPQASTPHHATGCTHSESSGVPPETGAVSAGGLSFPLSVAPDWRRKAEHRVPNSIDAVSLVETVSETADMSWIGQVTVGVTNFDQSLSLADQAALMVKCIVDSDLYDGSSPVVAEFTPKPGRLDGTPTSTVEVPISVTIADPTVRGDDLVLTIVGTSPTTYFLGSSPIGDADRRAVVEAALKNLHLSAV